MAAISKCYRIESRKIEANELGKHRCKGKCVGDFETLQIQINFAVADAQRIFWY